MKHRAWLWYDAQHCSRLPEQCDIGSALLRGISGTLGLIFKKRAENDSVGETSQKPTDEAHPRVDSPLCHICISASWLAERT